MKNKTFWGIGVVVAIIIVLLMIPKFSGRNSEFMSRLKAANADCLVQGHANLAQHIHPHLAVIVGEQAVTIPGNVGIIPTCMAEIHTHDSTGVIHIETVEAGKNFALKDFFAVWGEEFDKVGYERVVFVDSEPNLEGGELILKDGQEVVVMYETKQ